MSTNWIVLFGVPRSGVDAVQDLLKEQGHKVLREAARRIIDEEMAKGKSIEEIREDEAAFQRRVLAKKLEDEKNLSPEQTVFLNRGTPCSIAYYAITAGIDPEEAKVQCKRGVYRKVFYLEPLLYVRDYARTETEEQREALGPALVDAYIQVGYEDILEIVPAELSPEEKVQFILERI